MEGFRTCRRQTIPSLWKADLSETRYGDAVDVERAADLYAQGRTSARSVRSWASTASP
jgi:hypothetical protein